MCIRACFSVGPRVTLVKKQDIAASLVQRRKSAGEVVKIVEDPLSGEPAEML